MCRFAVYRGREILMSDLLTRPTQSLIRQSYKAREREEPLNGDGFGVGWYVHEIDPTPCVFTSVTPAWSNRNLYSLADKTRSTCFFAHVRAASPRMLVSEVNCHPFQYRQFLWMHNGSVAGFPKIKRRLRERLSDELYNFTQGTTDSEQAFALFLHKLSRHFDDYSDQTLEGTMIATIQQLRAWQAKAGIDQPSYLNFAVTDGHNVVATRYVSGSDRAPMTLYLSQGERLEHLGNGKYRMVPSSRGAGAALVASEPLTDDRSLWEPVPRNHLVTITPELHIRTRAID